MEGGGGEGDFGGGEDLTGRFCGQEGSKGGVCGVVEIKEKEGEEINAPEGA